jgi:GNAT superfamily N-acetyltransferase
MWETSLILTGTLAVEIERALAQAAASRIAAVGRDTTVDLGVEVRRFGQIAATLVRRPRWYYGYFGGLIGLWADDWASVDQAREWLRTAGGPTRAYISPYTAPAGESGRYLDDLTYRGFVPAGFMSVLFSRAEEDTAAATTVEIREASEDPDAFLNVWLASLEEPERTGLRGLPAAEFANWRSFVAYLDGEPAGVGSLYVAEGIGVLAAAATLPERRGRGVQTALLRRRIAEAARAGCELVASQATPGTTSERNMQRVGLRPAFGQVLFVERLAPARSEGDDGK